MVGLLVSLILTAPLAAEPAGGACPLAGDALSIALSNPETAERFDLEIASRADCSVEIRYAAKRAGAEGQAIRREYPADVMAELWPVLGGAADVGRLRSDRPCPGQRAFTVRRGRETRRFCAASETGRALDSFRGEIQLLLTYF